MAAEKKKKKKKKKKADPPFKCELITSTAYQRSKPCEEV
jgi:hypothetical protein